MHREVKLGNSEKTVTAIGLGAMPLSLVDRPDEKIAFDVIKAFIDAGGNFIDTANVYCKDDNEVGHNEKLIHRALKKFGKLNDVIVATKGGLTRPRGRWDCNATPQWLRTSCEKSLMDLNTDSIFLYQLHAPDPDVPFTESVGELARLQQEGKIEHIGLSNVNLQEIMTALTIVPILSVQNRCNIFEKKSFDRGIVDLCESENIVFIPHSPVGGHFDHKKHAQSRPLKNIAQKHGVSTYQIMLAWLLHKGSHILPIPGASKVNSITDGLQALEINLDSGEMNTLDHI